MIERIRWLGHASFKIRTDAKLIYIDPWEIRRAEPADLIFITHSHYDHLSSEDLRKIVTSQTYIIAPPDSKTGIPAESKFIAVSPGDEREIEGIKFKVIPAYNIKKQFHPKSKAWVGYVVEIEGTKIYHAGDTDLIPEMKNLEVDIALLPIGGTYTMNPEEASEAAKIMKTRIVVPMHYGKIVGSEKDLEILRASLPEGIKLEILPVSD